MESNRSSIGRPSPHCNAFWELSPPEIGRRRLSGDVVRWPRCARGRGGDLLSLKNDAKYGTEGRKDRTRRSAGDSSAGFLREQQPTTFNQHSLNRAEKFLPSDQKKKKPTKVTRDQYKHEDKHGYLSFVSLVCWFCHEFPVTSPVCCFGSTWLFALPSFDSPSNNYDQCLKCDWLMHVQLFKSALPCVLSF